MNWIKYRVFYFALSTLLIGVGGTSLALWGLNLGLEFKGGTLVEYKIDTEIENEKIISDLAQNGIAVSSIQKVGEDSYIFKLEEITEENREKISELLPQLVGADITEKRFEQVGPSIGPELIKKTYYAVLIATITILLWVAYQFKSIKYGVSAILAMLHDSFILLGMFALLGHLFQAEVDFLFITAILTTLSFSVHDTIVVYDRIREIRKKNGGEIGEIANRAISETMRRSINNSLTIIFMLLALIVFGGNSIRWFSVALLLGTILGTYSSPFIAVPLLVTWEGLQRRFKKGQ